VRGFGHVKARNRAQWKLRSDRLVQRLRGELPAEPVQFVDAA
jgi:hypothetical protein